MEKTELPAVLNNTAIAIPKDNHHVDIQTNQRNQLRECYERMLYATYLCNYVYKED